ncbi:hypothetical protein M529_04795 [Sphingobium ummariense RL-3]|uniref:Uncharacterized protein n=1 Tax=Sphingobium ummariense RL-3 TaxID=1346791 RepID=T0KJ94_9SPHN|nr:hypothetical protein M529_04795 [Sphingobium ummariense RL-3]
MLLMVKWAWIKISGNEHSEIQAIVRLLMHGEHDYTTKSWRF